MAQVAFDLFRKNYRWEQPIRSIGLRGAGLIEASGYDQLSLFLDDNQRQKRERIDGVVDGIRSRFGYMSIQRATIFADPQLAGIRPKEHVVHPVGYFGR
jgi:DNA polymerase-4